LNGTVNASGFQTTVTFEYGETVSYGDAVAASPSPVSGSSDTQVSAGLAGLSPNQLYHFRVVGQNIADTAVGGDMTFTTGARVPTVITSPLSAVHATLAAGGGIVTSGGGSAVKARGVCWHTSSPPTLANGHSSDGAGLGPFSSLVSGLSPETTYYVRAYASNQLGTGYGRTLSFTTAAMPVLTITSPMNGATVNEVVLITATTSSTATAANFYIDDQWLGASVRSGDLFSIQWDTRPYAQGAHMIRVTAQDQHGQALLDEVEVVVMKLGISLSVLRKEDRALTFKIYLAEVAFSVANPGNIAVARYVVQRSVNGGAFASIAELTRSNQSDGSFVYYDKTIGGNARYSYKIVAQDSGGNVLSVSETMSI
jgi:hypothetical protein